jgi:hypothetical protein
MKPEWQRHVDACKEKLIETNPDGNCFFNSASIQLTGSESSHNLLRLHTAIELLTSITQHQDDMSLGGVMSEPARA